MVSNSKSLAFVTYALIILYTSFIPFELRDLTIEEAIRRFLNIEYLDLSIVSRADWIANILLYIPFAYLGMFVFSGFFTNRFSKAISVVLVCFLGTIIVLGTEFVQIFFAPRTVSLNDLLAETIGLCLGVSLWLLFSAKFSVLLKHLSTNGATALSSVLIIYIVMYVGFMIFPFDFVVSLEELQWKLNQGLFSVTMLACDQVLVCYVKLIIEIFLVIPIGIYLIMRFKGLGLFSVFILGGIFGLVIEGLQFFLASGVSQGLSVIARAVGFLLAAWLLGGKANQLVLSLYKKRKSIILVTSPVYFFIVIYLNKLMFYQYNSFFVAQQKLGDLNFLPFYYHYFTTETEAVVNLLSYFAIYSIIGLGVALWRMESHIEYYLKDSTTIAVPLVFVISSFIETVKLFVEGEKPDPSNILIGVFAAYLGVRLVYWLIGFLELQMRGRKKHTI